MRKIDFQAKRLADGQWVFGSLVVQEDGTVWIGRAVRGRSAKTWKQVDPKTVGQFTGFVDAEGKPIFEGDILLVTDEWGGHYITPVTEEGGAMVVDVEGLDYDETAIGWAIDAWRNMGSNWRVVGNIHDGASIPDEVI